MPIFETLHVLSITLEDGDPDLAEELNPIGEFTTEMWFSLGDVKGMLVGDGMYLTDQTRIFLRDVKFRMESGYFSHVRITEGE